MSEKKRNKEIVLVCNSGTVAELRRTGSPLIANPTVDLLIYPDDSHTELASALEEQRLLIPGAMLIRSPYDRSKYSLADKADENFLREKHFLTSLIAGLIGAKKVSVQQIDIVEGDKVRHFEIEGKYENAGGSIDLKDKDVSQFISSLHLIDTYQANPVRANDARKVLEENGLHNDQNIITLVRAAELGLARKRRQILLKVIDDARHSFSVAASLDIPFTLDLAVKYQSVVQKKREYRLLLNIDFPE